MVQKPALLSVAVVGLFAAAVGVTVYANVFTVAPLELVSSPDLFAACPSDGAGINFPGAAVEPSIQSDITNPNQVVGIYQQDPYSTGGSKGLIAVASFNAGASWATVPVPTLTRCGGGEFDRLSNASLSLGPTGTAHASAVVMDAAPFVGFLGDNAVVYTRSLDGIQPWKAPIVLRRDVNPRQLNGRSSITADPNNANYIYTVWDQTQATDNPSGIGFRGRVYFTRTADGGNSWEPARTIYETSGNRRTIGNQIVVGPQGELIDIFTEAGTNPSGQQQFVPLLSYIVSTDKGQSWSKAKRIDQELPMSVFRADSTIDTDPVPCPDPAKTGACPVRGGDLIPSIATDKATGRLYAVWMDARFSAWATGSYQYDSIAFSQSADGGVTWSPAIRVNQTPVVPVQSSQAFTPTIRSADDGTITVTYFDFRNDAVDQFALTTDYWAVHCHAASEDCSSPASWKDEANLSGVLDLRQAAYARGYYIGERQGLTSQGHAFRSLFALPISSGLSSIFTTIFE